MDISMDREDMYAYSISLSTNKALVKSFVEEVFNNHDISAAEKYLAGKCINTL
jgi:hypothetical protein